MEPDLLWLPCEYPQPLPFPDCPFLSPPLQDTRIQQPTRHSFPLRNHIKRGEKRHGRHACSGLPSPTKWLHVAFCTCFQAHTDLSRTCSSKPVPLASGSCKVLFKCMHTPVPSAEKALLMGPDVFLSKTVSPRCFHRPRAILEFKREMELLRSCVVAGIQHNACGEVRNVVIYKMSPIKLKIWNHKFVSYLSYNERKAPWCISGNT